MISQTLIIALLARLLTPAEFGLFAISNVAFIITTNLGQIGIVSAVMREASLDRRTIGSAIVLSSVVGFVLGMITFSVAPVIAGKGDEIHSTLVANLIRVNSATIFIYSISSPAIAVLSRELRYRELGLVQLGALVTGTGLVASALALAGAGAWSLAMGSLTNISLVCLGCWWILRDRWALSWSSAQVRQIGLLGVKMSLMHGLDLLWKQLPIILAYSRFSASSVGFYQRSQVLVDTGIHLTVQNISTTFFATAVSARDRETFLQATVPPLTGLYGAFLVPVSVFVFNMAPEIIQTVLGDQWIPAAPILTLLMPAFCTLIISQVVSCALEVVAQVTARVVATGGGVLILATFCLALSYLGAIGLAIAVIISGAFISLANFLAGAFILRISLFRTAKWLIPAVFIGATMEISLLPFRLLVLNQIESSWTKLGLALAAAAIIFIASFRAIIRGSRRKELLRYLVPGSSRAVLAISSLLGLK
jgi:O-antigen/teichoic acid export membrane protein